MPNSKNLKGRLLIADAFMDDMYFSRKVLLLFEHTKDGAAGLVLNKPSILNPKKLFPELKLPDSCLFEGGPVERDQVFLLHSKEDALSNSIEIVSGVCFGGDVDMVQNILNGKQRLHGPFRFFSGYAGWSAGQLEAELDQKSWYVGPLCNQDHVFSDFKNMWPNSVKLLGTKYLPLVNAPFDPNWN